jgi:hypothetical protein
LYGNILYTTGEYDMGMIKGVLKKGLETSLRMAGGYVRELEKLPRGSLVKKNIKGHEYYYLLFRKNGKVKFIYKGKVSENEIKKYKDAKKCRAKYRKLLSKVKKQIRFFRNSLRGRELL